MLQIVVVVIASLSIFIHLLLFFDIFCNAIRRFYELIIYRIVIFFRFQLIVYRYINNKCMNDGLAAYNAIINYR